MPKVSKLAFEPRNEAQKRLKEAIANHDIVLAIGPAGSGKSHAAVALAVALHRCKYAHKIVFCRPAVGSEELGFFPGTEDEKIAPFLRPLYTILEKVGSQTYSHGNMIEPASFATMRGATYDNSVVIIDEAQNATFGQLEMALTRLGEGSKMIVTGDPDQTDLPRGQSGLSILMKLLHNDMDIPTITFTADDNLRHRLVRKLTSLFSQYRNELNGNDLSLRQPTYNLDGGRVAQLYDVRDLDGFQRAHSADPAFAITETQEKEMGTASE